MADYISNYTGLYIDDGIEIAHQYDPYGKNEGLVPITVKSGDITDIDWISLDTAGMATRNWVESQGYLKSEQFKGTVTKIGVREGLVIDGGAAVIENTGYIGLATVNNTNATSLAKITGDEIFIPKFSVDIYGRMIFNTQQYDRIKFYNIYAPFEHVHEQYAPINSPIFIGTPIINEQKISTDTNNKQIATTEFVHDVVNQLPRSMTFKGTIGIGGVHEQLPTPSKENSGDTYRILSQVGWPERNPITIFEAGSTAISDGTNWIKIPAGEAPSGTVVNVDLNAGEGINAAGGPITTSGAFVVSHGDTVDKTIPEHINYNGTLGKVPVEEEDPIPDETELLDPLQSDVGDGYFVITTGTYDIVHVEEDEDEQITRTIIGTITCTKNDFVVNDGTQWIILDYSVEEISPTRWINSVIVDKFGHISSIITSGFNTEGYWEGTASKVENNLTFINDGTGEPAPTEYNGSNEIFVSYNTIGAASESHTHGNIKSDGSIDAINRIHDGDNLLIYNNNSNQLFKTTLSFGTETNKFLSNDGSWRIVSAENYYHSDGIWNGFKYIATSHNGAPVLSFTLPVGDTSETVAIGNHSHDFTDLSNIPNTIAGYGITDAKIEGGIITIGDNSLTPITSHQSLAGYVPNTRTINGKGLYSNITLTAADVGALNINTTYARGETKNGDAVYATRSGGIDYLNSGSNTTGVYFDNGRPKSCMYSVNTNVPADAKFTDTTYQSLPAKMGGSAVSLVTTGEKYLWNQGGGGGTVISAYHYTGTWDGLKYTAGKSIEELPELIIDLENADLVKKEDVKKYKFQVEDSLLTISELNIGV